VAFTRGNLKRVAGRGLSYAGSCLEQCSMAANLLRQAKPVARANSSASTTRLVLRPRKAYRKVLLRASRLKMTLQAVVQAASGPSHRASQVLTIRR
jgi:hypothetical protein